MEDGAILFGPDTKWCIVLPSESMIELRRRPGALATCSAPFLLPASITAQSVLLPEHSVSTPSCLCQAQRGLIYSSDLQGFGKPEEARVNSGCHTRPDEIGEERKGCRQGVVQGFPGYLRLDLLSSCSGGPGTSPFPLCTFAGERSATRGQGHLATTLTCISVLCLNRKDPILSSRI